MSSASRPREVLDYGWAGILRVSPPSIRAALLPTRRRRERTRQFRQRFSRAPDVAAPVLFTEKIVARILAEQPLPLQEIWDDKVTAPIFARRVARHPVRVPARYGLWPQVEISDLAGLPRPFVLKANLGSAPTTVVRDQSPQELTEIIARTNKEAGRSVNARGERYQSFIIAEEFLAGPGGAFPADLKFHCFHGADGSFDWFLQYDTDRFGEHRQDIFDSNLARAPFTFAGTKPSDTLPALPENIEEFVAVAQDLSEPFDYIRVDLYDLDGEVVFGELTPCHRSGLGFVEPEDWEARLGEMWEWNPEGFFASTLVTPP